MNKIYIDITESFLWHGKVTGIIRVMDEISSRFYYDSNVDAEFIVWNEKTNYFFKIDYKDIFTIRENDLTNKQPIPNIVTNTLSVKKKFYFKVPLSRTFIKIIKYTRNKLTNYISSPKSFNLEDNSILFMPHGGVWGSSKYNESITNYQTNNNINIVPILYDLCPVITPQFCSEGVREIFYEHMKKILVSSNLVLTISENTKNDALAWVDSIGSGKIKDIEVFRLGDEIDKKKSLKPKNIDLPSEYILNVGTIEARKNHTLLYYAYKIAQKKNINLPPIVIVGRKGWLADDIFEVMTVDPTIKEKFIFLSDIDDKELNWLYAHASFSVYPSFYEGWGLPVAESLLNGLPCIASNTSSIPEVGGNLIEYFSPFSPEELLGQILQLTNNPILLSEKRKEILERYKATSWDESYAEVLRALIKL